MSRWALKQLEAPSIEPVTLEELKLQAHITHDIQDSTLTSYIKAGRIQAETYQRQSYITQKWELTLDHIPLSAIKLLRGPVIDVESVTVYDGDNNETSIDVSDFYIDKSFMPAKMCLIDSASWPNVNLRSIGGLKIVYTAGYGADATTTPEDVKHAIILFASFADDNRAADNADLPKSFFDILGPNRVNSNVPW